MFTITCSVSLSARPSTVVKLAVRLAVPFATAVTVSVSSSEFGLDVAIAGLSIEYVTAGLVPSTDCRFDRSRRRTRLRSHRQW